VYEQHIMSDNNSTNMPTEEVMVVQGAVPHVDDVNDGDIEDNGATIEDVNSNNKDMNATEVTTSSTLTTKQKQEKWITKQRLCHVVFNMDNSDIISIAGVDIKSIIALNIRAFARTNNIQIPKDKTKKQDFIDAMVIILL
jgi:hypothetical protein